MSMRTIIVRDVHGQQWRVTSEGGGLVLEGLRGGSEGSEPNHNGFPRARPAVEPQVAISAGFDSAATKILTEFLKGK